MCPSPAAKLPRHPAGDGGKSSTNAPIGKNKALTPPRDRRAETGAEVKECSRIAAELAIARNTYDSRPCPEHRNLDAAITAEAPLSCIGAAGRCRAEARLNICVEG